MVDKRHHQNLNDLTQQGGSSYFNLLGNNTTTSTTTTTTTTSSYTDSQDDQNDVGEANPLARFRCSFDSPTGGWGRKRNFAHRQHYLLEPAAFLNDSPNDDMVDSISEFASDFQEVDYAAIAKAARAKCIREGNELTTEELDALLADIIEYETREQCRKQGREGLLAIQANFPKFCQCVFNRRLLAIYTMEHFQTIPQPATPTGGGLSPELSEEEQTAFAKMDTTGKHNLQWAASNTKNCNGAGERGFPSTTEDSTQPTSDVREEGQGFWVPQQQELSLQADTPRPTPTVRVNGTESCTGDNKMLTLKDHRVAVLSYGSFRKLRKEVPQVFKEFLQVSTFFELMRDHLGHVSCVALLNHVMRLSCLKSLRSEIYEFTTNTDEILTKQSLKKLFTTWIRRYAALAVVPSYAADLETEPDQFKRFYVQFLVTKVLFYLDPLRTGHITTRAFILCDPIQPLISLRLTPSDDPPIADNVWAPETAAVLFVKLLETGTLSEAGMQEFVKGTYTGNTCITDTTIKRVFDEGNTTYTNNGHSATISHVLDLPDFLEMVFALEAAFNVASLKAKLLQSTFVFEPKGMKPVLRWLWRILDRKHQDRFDAADMEYFYDDMKRTMEQLYEENNIPETMPEFKHIQAEYMDMLRTEHPDFITKAEFLASPQEACVISMCLMNPCMNRRFENREAYIASQVR